MVLHFRFHQVLFLILFSCSLLPHPGQADPFKLPPVQRLELSNGIKVVLMQQKEVPLLSIDVAFRGGSSLDAEQRAGLASLTTEALALGTKSYKKAVIEEKMDFFGATLDSQVRQDFMTVSLSLASRDVQTLLPLLSEIVSAPVFPEGEVIKLKERQLSALKKLRESPNLLADQYFNKLIFNEHPYGRPVHGSLVSLSRLSRQDLANFYQNSFQPQNALITVVGDMEPQAMGKLLQESFGAWAPAKPAAQERPQTLEVPRHSEAHVLLVDKPDATETAFRIGGPGVARNAKDWVALQVINTILGGRFTSWLNEELRVKTGLTYGARSRFDAFKSGGTFAISSFTANDNSFKALDLALATYKRFCQEGIDEKTLDSAKAYVKGQFPPRYETLESLSQLLVDMWIYELPDQMIDTFEADVDRLTLAQTQELIKRLFPTDHLDIVLIGKAAQLREGARKYGRVIVSDMERVDEAVLLH